MGNCIIQGFLQDFDIRRRVPYDDTKRMENQKAKLK